ncbi:Uncharacterised protein [Mycobacterium tuberculosis]|uniref:Uncharacterized protein n=1 Tax=Mycobacterium tuberculosis TaxID=1773 RepID=A0A655ELH7_MYCTX|nr:Uncharacterised protein [Mycobacterium tuberculosis]CNV26507.1 Uncharacterised protein [Mycobacterium tuberculosis]
MLAAVAAGLFRDDEPSAHRKISLGGQDAAAWARGSERHSVGMRWQNDVGMQVDITLGQRDRNDTADSRHAGRCDLGEPAFLVFGGNRFWLAAFQPQQYRRHGAMTGSGGRERAEQIHSHRLEVIQVAPAAQRNYELVCRAHRSHGVGTGRPDADGEQVEDADGHVRCSSG